jgi:hypothetical protein
VLNPAHWLRASLKNAIKARPMGLPGCAGDGIDHGIDLKARVHGVECRKDQANFRPQRHHDQRPTPGGDHGCHVFVLPGIDRGSVDRSYTRQDVGDRRDGWLVESRRKPSIYAIGRLVSAGRQLGQKKTPPKRGVFYLHALVASGLDWPPDVGEGFDVEPACCRWQSFGSPPEAPLLWPFVLVLLVGLTSSVPLFPEPLLPEFIDPLLPPDMPFVLFAPAPELVPEPCPALPAVCAIVDVARPIVIADTAIILRNILSSTAPRYRSNLVAGREFRGGPEFLPLSFDNAEATDVKAVHTILRWNLLA